MREPITNVSVGNKHRSMRLYTSGVHKTTIGNDKTYYYN